ncbi:MAG TPA: hypothetical protein VFV02_06515, partial [Acidimicrobiales bacterium]|nr:hypothetical protein [Acidimicrobiales bacterium]
MTVPAVDLTDSSIYVGGVPYDRFAELRRQGVVWQDERDGPGFWAVTRYEDCVAVNREYETFSSARKAVFIWELPEAELPQQQ